MQTLCAHGEFRNGVDRNDGRGVRSRRTAIITVFMSFVSLLCCVSLLGIPASPAAAAVPGISGRGTDESDLSACERALSLGFGDLERYQSALPSYLRLFSAVDAQSRWHTAAVECPQRFAEGTVRSALADDAARALTDRTGITSVVSSSSASVDDDLTMHVDATTAAALSLAEDRAGFAFEILASRHNADATLYHLSDQHKSNAQVLATVVKQESDPRQKIYAVDSLIANPDETTDPTNGLKAPTAAIVEMNCALEQLDAVSATNGTNATESNTASASSSSSSDSTATRTDTEIHDLSVISSLIAAHIATAIDLGYPAMETALLH
ncbi:hypothetical protein BTIS_0554 [Bifidobacterium tissieri]|uniref:DUF4439 domain-containing protein n=2 Tax=Bifidobacterium tissieri TaxID=1630162 RepID=A0A261FIL4_9BIFI|nr:hypothetical protein BTIS_0554 [Bifidobacterium tissieri]